MGTFHRRRGTSGFRLLLGLGTIGALFFLPSCSSATDSAATTPAEIDSVTSCFSSPHSCGYPDETNTGPVGALTPSGSINVTTDGQVLEDLDITGQIVINADDVTIRNSRITATQAGSSAFIVQIDSGSGVKIIDTEIRGKGEGEETAEAAVRGSAFLERDHFYNCNECVQYDELPIRDTYMEITSMHAGAHVENVYGCSQRITVEHSTLFNAIEQTATVIGDTICNGNRGNQFTVKDSLLAGGGGVLEPQANENFSGADTVVTGNRFARCLGAEYTANNGHLYCQGGPDANGYFPNGGSYYLSCCLGGPLTWKDNVWDDNSQPVCPDGSPGCGSSQPPPGPRTPPTASAAPSLLAALADTDPPAPVRCVVPRLLGASVKAARRRARRAHCRIGIVRHIRGTLRRSGSVVKQRPRAGRKVARWTKIIVALGERSRRLDLLERLPAD